MKHRCGVGAERALGVGRLDRKGCLGHEQEDHHVSGLDQVTAAFLDQWRRCRDQGGLLHRRRVTDQPQPLQERGQPDREIGRRQRPDLIPVDRPQLVDVELGGVLVDPRQVELGGHLSQRKGLPVLPRRPAKQREVVADRLGQIARVAVPVDRDDAVSLGQPLPVLAEHVRQVREDREVRLGHAHRGIDGELARC